MSLFVSTPKPQAPKLRPETLRKALRKGEEKQEAVQNRPITAKPQTAPKQHSETKPLKTRSVTGAKRIVNRELAPFSRQLAAMLRAGMSLIVSLTTLEEQAIFPPFRKLLTDVRLGVESGATFSESLALFPRVFGPLYINIVKAGERSGEFAVTMRQLGDLLESTARLKRKVKSAMSYPVVVLCVAILIACGLITFVVPIFADMFSEFGADLPGPTMFLMNLSTFFRHYYMWIIGTLGGAGFLFTKWKKTDVGARKIDGVLLRLPVFGVLIQKTSIARVSRILALMMTSGVPILDSLEIVANASGNQIIGDAILDARATVEQGDSLAAGLEGKPCIPTLMVRMLAAGEKSGQVDVMCVNIADTYDDEVETMIAGFSSLIEPILMVFLGTLIGGIVIALFLPIFKLATIVS